MAASVLSSVTKKYSKSSHMLKPRLARTCLKHFLDPSKPIGTHYGGIIGLQAIGGSELVRALIIPNLKEYDGFLADVSMDAENEANKKGSEMVIEALVEALMSLEAESVGAMNGLANGHAVETRKQVAEKIGELLAGRVMELGKPKVVKALLEC
jgi:transcription initiation factor TFIID subunit 6